MELDLLNDAEASHPEGRVAGKLEPVVQLSCFCEVVEGRVLASDSRSANATTPEAESKFKAGALTCRTNDG